MSSAMTSEDAMDEETGATFLLKRARLTRERMSDKELQLARRISEELGDLPLALKQAGAYIERTQCSLECYLQIYEQAHERLLAESGFPVERTDYKHIVAITWSLSFERLAQERNGQAATDLLRLCAFLAPDDIPVPMFEATLIRDFLRPDPGTGTAGPLQLEEALATLSKYSLIQREEDALFIHRLVQTVVRDAMSEEEHALWVERVTQLMSVVFPDPQKVENWPICQYLLPHMLTCASWIEQVHVSTERAAFLLNQTAYYLADRGSYAEAEPLYQRALAIRERELGAEHPYTAASLNNLASLYENQGKYAEAEPLYQRALSIRERELGASHLDTAETLNNLAALYENQGKYAEAEPLYQRALSIYERERGATHPDTALSLNNLASLYHKQGKYAEAELRFQSALAIRERELGASHPDTAQSLNNLAYLYCRQGKYTEAEPLYQRALAIHERELGVSHPNTATSLSNLANLYGSQGKYTEAEPLYQRALAIFINVLGEEHPDTQTVLRHYQAFLSEREGATEKKRRSTPLQWIRSLLKIRT